MNTHSEKARVVTLLTLEELEKIRESWIQIQRHPNSDFDRYKSYIEAKKGNSQPYVLVLFDKENIRSILVGRREPLTFDFGLGYKPMKSIKVSSLTFIHGGHLGDESDQASQMLIDQVLSGLKNGDADVAYFNHYTQESCLFSAITSMPTKLCRDTIFITRKHWMMTMPGSLEEFLSRMIAKHRYWLKRIKKVLEKEYPGQVKYRMIRSADEVAELCRDAEEVAQKTYQRSLGVGFRNSNDTLDWLNSLAAKNRLRGYLLYVKETPTAFWIGNIHNKSFHLDYTGFDPDYRKHEVGTVLFLEMLNDLCVHDSGQIINIDFGLGDAQYKQRFGDASWTEAAAYIYAPTVRGISLNLFNKSNKVAWKKAEEILDRLKLKQTVKTLWRRRLS